MLDLISNLVIEDVPLAITALYNSKGTSGKRDLRAIWTLFIQYEGKISYKNKGKIIISDKSNIVILPRGCSYEYTCLETGHFACIDFICKKEHDEVLQFRVPSTDEFLSIAKQIECKDIDKKPAYRIEKIKDMYRILIKLARLTECEYVPSAKSKKLTTAIEYMQMNYTKRISNDYLASISGVSTVYFRKLFKDIYGLSPISYLKRIKIEKACEMLDGEFGSISDIATSLGYGSVYAFSKDFKNHVGIAPTKYHTKSSKSGN